MAKIPEKMTLVIDMKKAKRDLLELLRICQRIDKLLGSISKKAKTAKGMARGK